MSSTRVCCSMRASEIAASWLMNSLDSSGRLGLLDSSYFGTGPNKAMMIHDAIASMEMMANQRNARDRSKAWAISPSDAFFGLFVLRVFSSVLTAVTLRYTGFDAES